VQKKAFQLATMKRGERPKTPRLFYTAEQINIYFFSPSADSGIQNPGFS
jgi:hypothetical protein